MKKDKFYRLNILIIMLAFLAGIIFFICGFSVKVPKGVTVNGVSVGGKSREEAARLVRENIVGALKERSLTVYGKKNKYVFAYPEIGYKDNLQRILRTAEKGASYTADISYYLNGIGEITAAICADESRPVVEPSASFNTEGEAFTYREGSDGKRADRLKLLSDIRASLNGGFEDVYLKVDTLYRKTTLDEVKYDTRRISTFTTYFDGSNANRSHNIRLAARKINGTVLACGEQFSFNQTVGERRADRGFKRAKIIENGEFVQGMGGGVCQTSTTLYNAALLAGCKISEYHAHSLSVSYVPPSFDAMVSGSFFDLKFTNTTGYPLYFRARTGENFVAFDIYGRGDGAKYSYSSSVTGSIPAPVETTTDRALVKDGRDGIISEGYLVVTRGGVTKTTLVRRDKYSPVKRVELLP